MTMKWVAVQDGEELRIAINNKLPAKIDIGPVYNVDPKHRNAYSGIHGHYLAMPAGLTQRNKFDTTLW